MKWIYESPIGTLSIESNPDKTYSIIISGENYGGYQSAFDAADDVYSFATGCPEWDLLILNDDIILDVPEELDGWKRLR
jgi:hypothetical protein